METIEFRNLEELYNRVKPALYSKLMELYRLGYKIVNEKDIWNYLVNEWKNDKDLTLAKMVNDILKLDLKKINIERYDNNDK